MATTTSSSSAPDPLALSNVTNLPAQTMSMAAPSPSSPNAAGGDGVASSSSTAPQQPVSPNKTNLVASTSSGSIAGHASTSAPNSTKKQQAAAKARINALSKNLMTRLRYASFKVEHGWSKQSLSEVENLYYRQRRSGSGSGAQISPSNAVAAGVSSSSRASYVPSTPVPRSSSGGSKSIASWAATAAAAAGSSASSAHHADDVFMSQAITKHGLSTPPATGGNQAPFGLSSYSSSHAKEVGSSLPTPRSPNPHTLNGPSSSKSSYVPSTASSGKVAGQAQPSSSYADFWSKMASGSSSAASTSATATATASRKRSFETAEASGASRAGLGGGSTGAAAGGARKLTPSPPSVGVSPSKAVSGDANAGGPNKRVRIDGPANNANGASRDRAVGAAAGLPMRPRREASPTPRR